MKKPMIFLALLTTILAACSSAPRAQNGSPNSQTLNPMSQLAAGTLKLDGTAHAVTKDQAAALIPLWQVYKQLTASDAAAQEEINGLSAQIRDTLTSDQRKAISDMKLTQSDIFAFMQPAGSAAAAGSGKSSGNGTSQGGGFPGGGPAGGMPPGGMDPGGMPPGGGFAGGGTTTRASGTQTANSAQGTRPANMDRVPSALIDAVVQYLQKIASS